jgi:hypothetical protein
MIYVFFSLVLLASLSVIFVPTARTPQMGTIQNDALIAVCLIIVYRGWRMGLLTANNKAFFERLRAGERVTGNFFERVTLAVAVVAKLVLAFAS